MCKSGSPSLSSAANEPAEARAAVSKPAKPRSHRRACEACRKLKVQCVFENPKSPECRHCASAQRKCVIAVRRARHMASHTVIANLEMKVEALTKSLQGMEAMSGSRSQSSRVNTDVFSNGTVSSEAATRCYYHFARHMLPHMPIIAIPADLSADEMRKSKPVLFLAIIHAASGLLPPDVQQGVNRALSRVLADKVLVDGEKSLELIQTMQLSCTWYYPPERFEALKFYQLIHNAAIMAIDIGLSRKRIISSLKSVEGLDETTKLNSKLPDPTTAEARRAWVTCFFLASGTAQNLRRLNLIRWTSYLADCVRYLENSPEALQSDKVLCRWVRLQQFADDVSIRLSIEDPGACAGLSDSAIQYGMKGLEAQLESVTSIPLEEKSTPLKLGELLTKLYMHEVALHTGSAEESDMQPPFTEEALKSIRPTQAEKLSAAHIESLSNTLATVHAAFDAFLSMSGETLRELPTFHFVRLVYACIVVVKLAIDTTVPSSEIGRMFSLDDLKVDKYLSSLVANLNQAAEGNRCPNAAKFGFVINMLRLVYRRNVLKDQWDPNTEVVNGSTVTNTLRGRPAQYRHAEQLLQTKTPETPYGNPQATGPGLYEANLQFGAGQAYPSSVQSQSFSFGAKSPSQIFKGQNVSQNLTLPDINEMWPNMLDFQNVNIDFGSFDMNDFNDYLDGNGCYGLHS